MFARLSRMLRAWMGFFISLGEDPEVMLEDAIEEMRVTMPKLNSVLVATRATVIRLEEERDQLARQDRQLTGSIQAALRDGTASARSLAEEDALSLQHGGSPYKWAHKHNDFTVVVLHSLCPLCCCAFCG